MIAPRVAASGILNFWLMFLDRTRNSHFEFVAGFGRVRSQLDLKTLISARWPRLAARKGGQAPRGRRKNRGPRQGQ
jgi:hypothetical protein